MKTFQDSYNFCDKWLSTVIETDEQWDQFAKEFGQMADALDYEHNPLGEKILTALFDFFNELYKDGKKPVPVGYFGRDDI